MARNPPFVARPNCKYLLLRSPLPAPEQVKGRPTFARPAVDERVFRSWHDRLPFWHETSAFWHAARHFWHEILQLARTAPFLAQNVCSVARYPLSVARSNCKYLLLRSPLPAPEQVNGRPDFHGRRSM
ncbi:hypothetical protein [Alkalicoccus urumqiensis]|uniref:hypothetical protein n=1 Tax=Alkalicoccus urumqiensis TaxID=1548213 RepID=UPI0015E62016|nr:hypothetical protein [Alkalicoccus urumqiensis]